MGILVLIGVTVFLALVDIALKTSVESSMTEEEVRTACKGKLILRKVYNRGFCFNILKDKPTIVKYMSAFVTVIVGIWQMITLMRKKQYLKKLGLSLMMAGALSNTFDRWVRGYVVDYIGFQTKQEKTTRLTYNLGDFFIGAGNILVLLCNLFQMFGRIFRKMLKKKKSC